MNNIYPVLSLLLAATLWGIFWYPLRLLQDNGLSGLWATFFIYLGTLPILLVLIYKSYKDIKKNWLLLLLIAITSGWCNTAFILAIIDGPIIRVMILFYVSPLWAAIFGVLFLNEKLSGWNIILLLIALLGVAIMLWQSEYGLPIPSSATDWLALSSGIAFALVNVFTRKAQSTPISLKISFTWLGVILMSIFLINISSSALNNAGSGVILSALSMGIVLVVIMSVSVVYGVSNMPVQRSAIILLFEIIVAAISASLLTNEIVSTQEWIGGLFILFAGYYSSKLNIKEAKL